jgi:hypothetical protein
VGCFHEGEGQGFFTENVFACAEGGDGLMGVLGVPRADENPVHVGAGAKFVFRGANDRFGIKGAEKCGNGLRIGIEDGGDADLGGRVLEVLDDGADAGTSADDSDAEGRK